MRDNQKAAFSARLIRAMKESSDARKDGTKHGVDTAKLQKKANVSREMARRYLEGLAIPNPDPMNDIADWLNVRVPWLRDGDGPMRHTGVSNDQGTYTQEYPSLTSALNTLPENIRHAVADDLERLVATIAASHITQDEKVRKTVELYNQMMAKQPNKKNKAS